MAAKKSKKTKLPKISEPSVVDKQVLNDDAITIEDVRDFVAKARKKKDNWANIADRSWAEIKKRNKRGQLWGGDNLNTNRRWTRYPLWWSCLMIRQPITFARLPVPVVKDTQGDDPFGRTACVIGERLTRGILKTFDAFPVISACNDDFLVTNFAWARAYYRKTETQEDEKIRLQVIQQPQQPPMEGQEPPQQLPPIFIDPATQQQYDNPLNDEFGPYVLSGKKVAIENEEVYLDNGLYCNLYVDPDAIKWSDVTRLAFEYQYSYRKFKKKFGQKALDKLVQSDIDEHKTGKPIIVFEYWDLIGEDDKAECRWFAENSEDFFQPKDIAPSELEEVKKGDNDGDKDKDAKMDHSDLYGLSDGFPCTSPLIINNTTDEFWPTPEFFQAQDMIDNIHQIASRQVLLTRAIRVRFLIDGSVPALKALLNDNVGEAGGVLVPNLKEALINAKGNDIRGLVAFFPIQELIEGLKNMYEAFTQALDNFYQVTGLSDLLRGQTSDGDKTYGERQLEGKFALNRIEPYQRKLQEWIKDNYQLLMELALKMFSDDSLDEYITPQTLDDEDKDRYVGALDLLKSNKRSRFRIDFETDSTVAINEQWKRQQATDLANTLTKAMESTANVAETQPELAKTELKVLKHLIGEFSDGKLFIDEIQDSIQEVIDKALQPKPTPPDPATLKQQFDMQKLSVDDRFRNLELQTSTQIELAKIQQKNRQDAIKSQMDNLKLAIDQGMSQQDLQLRVTEMQANIAQGWEELSLQKEALLADIQKEVGKSEIEGYRLMLDQRVKSQEMTLAESEQALRAFQVKIEASDHHASLQERIATEARLQKEDARADVAHQIDAVATLADAAKIEAPPISVDKSVTIHVKPPTPSKPKKPKA